MTPNGMITARGRAVRCARALAPRSNPLVGMMTGEEEDGRARAPDKAFACAWLDERAALVSTKCHRLFRFDFRRGGGGASARRREIAMDVGGARGSARGGARAIAQTKTRDRLCVSGGPGHDVIGFERGGEGDAIVPAYALRGHEDVVFGMDFIHRDALASASRDGSLRIFRLPRETSEEECAVCASPVVSIEPTRGGCGSRSSEKLRGVKLVYDAPSPQLATISSSGTVYQFDASTPHVVSQEYKLRGFAETSCVATDGRVVAVGSRAHIGLIDFRMRGVVASFAVHSTRRRSLSLSATRSLSFAPHESILTIGGGRENVDFFDVRMRRYLKHLEGRLGREPLNDLHAPAIFSHEWDPTGTRLLVAGGPLLELIPGFYVGLWL
tara:strand:+ start:447 stop:1598 length:1152 start_codon:yes stop_codon:yes gene_type:complete